jgi:hypothetical protein
MSFLLISFSRHFEGEGPKGGTLNLEPQMQLDKEARDRGKAD